MINSDTKSNNYPMQIPLTRDSLIENNTSRKLFKRKKILDDSFIQLRLLRSILDGDFSFAFNKVELVFPIVLEKLRSCFDNREKELDYFHLLLFIKEVSSTPSSYDIKDYLDKLIELLPSLYAKTKVIQYEKKLLMQISFNILCSCKSNYQQLQLIEGIKRSSRFNCDTRQLCLELFREILEGINSAPAPLIYNTLYFLFQVISNNTYQLWEFSQIGFLEKCKTLIGIFVDNNRIEGLANKREESKIICLIISNLTELITKEQGKRITYFLVDDLKIIEIMSKVVNTSNDKYIDLMFSFFIAIIHKYDPHLTALISTKRFIKVAMKSKEGLIYLAELSDSIDYAQKVRRIVKVHNILDKIVESNSIEIRMILYQVLNNFIQCSPNNRGWLCKLSQLGIAGRVYKDIVDSRSNTQPAEDLCWYLEHQEELL